MMLIESLIDLAKVMKSEVYLKEGQLRAQTDQTDPTDYEACADSLREAFNLTRELIQKLEYAQFTTEFKYADKRWTSRDDDKPDKRDSVGDAEGHDDEEREYKPSGADGPDEEDR